MRSFLAALAFLTILPVPFRPPDAVTVARARWWYPAVGLVLGVMLGGWAVLVGRLSSPALSAFLILAAWEGLSGALHLDGLCDLCDGLLGGSAPEDRLRIMKDPHLGTFGLAGGLFVLLGKWSALQALAGTGQGPRLVGTAAVVARCLVLVMAAGARYPRPEGTGKALVESVRGWEAWWFGALAALAALISPVLGGWREGRPASWSGELGGLIPFGAALAAVALLAFLCRRRLGGITGDCLGAGIETAEMFFLIGAAVSQGS